MEPGCNGSDRRAGAGRSEGRGLWTAVSVLALCLVASPLSRARGQVPAVTDADVELAIRRAVEWLWSVQGDDGQWHDDRYDLLYPGGLTALAALTLRTAGAGAGDPRLRRAVDYLIEHEDRIRSTYARSFRLMLWTALEPHKHRRQIRADVKLLASGQRANGAWGYGEMGVSRARRGWTDNSNSQLALLALWEGAQVGGEVNRIIWERAEEAWLACQNDDGGWGYIPRDSVNRLRPDSYGSMTAAGVATLYILLDQLYARSGGPFDGRRIPDCGGIPPGSQPLYRALDRAWDWLNGRFVPDRIPDFRSNNPGLSERWLTYYLYSVERAGVASGYKTFGVNNWYRDLAVHLVRTQEPDGNWGSIYSTCFGLLALCKGRTPIMINKLRYGSGGEWNNGPRDAANLSRWLARTLETPLTWQIVTLDSPEADVRDAPILYFSGHEAPQLSQLEREVLRDYVWSGGTVLAVACCSRPQFVEGVDSLFGEVFPQLTREVLPADHPLWSIRYPLEPAGDVVGYSDGCRTRLFLVTRGICGAWRQNLFARYEDEFRLAANLLAYATDRRPPRSVAPGMGAGHIAGLGPPPAGAPQSGTGSGPAAGSRILRVGRLRHGGDYWTHPYALARLSETLRDAFGLVLPEVPAVDPAGGDLGRFDVLWLTGHTLVLPDKAGLERLRRYLSGGGTLIATPCCGADGGRVAGDFEEVFLRLVEVLFGAGALKDVPADDPLVTGHLAAGGADGPTPVTGWLGSDLSRLRIRGFLPPAPTSGPDSSGGGVSRQGVRPPRRAAVTLKGVAVDDPQGGPRRWAVLYSPLDIHNGCDGHYSLHCHGYAPRDARAVAGNLLLYVHLDRSNPSAPPP